MWRDTKKKVVRIIHQQDYGMMVLLILLRLVEYWDFASLLVTIGHEKPPDLVYLECKQTVCVVKGKQSL